MTCTTVKYPFHRHDDGLVVTQTRNSEFEERPMTPGELAAREPALKIANDIYRHANQAGVCYIEIWELIAKTIDDTVAQSEAAAPSLEATCLTIQMAVSDYMRRTPPHLRDCDVLTGHIVRALAHAS